MKTTKIGNSLKLYAPVAGLMAGAVVVQASTDYGPAIYYSSCKTKWYTSGYGHHFAVCHDMEGYYASSRSYLLGCSSSVSIHYMVNGKQDTGTDAPAGQISQQVREAYYAWHVCCWNRYMYGTEHEGFASNPAWYTDAMYNATGPLQKHLCEAHGIPKDRNHVIGHNQWQNAAWRSWASANYSFSVWCNSHSDPGPYWNWSRLMNIILGVSSAPKAPSSLTLSVASSSQINLTWTDNSSNESGFKIERATSSGGPFTQIGTNAANDRTYSATGLSSGTTYWFRVRAWNSGGNSGYSNTASATTKDVIPGAPTSLTATAVSETQINLTWVNGSGKPDGVKVERSTDNVTFTQIAQLGVVTSYNNTGLAGNTTYYYRVRNFNTAGNGPYSAVAHDTTAPLAPSALTAASAGSGPTTWDKINLAWTDNSANEVGFKVERSPDNVSFTQIATVAAGTSTYQDSGLAAVHTYWYRVRSFNGNGNSAYSNTASAATPNPPPVLTAIGNKTLAQNTLLTFTATATDPNQNVVTTTWENFESYTNGTPNEQVMFNRPLNSATTSAFQDTSTNYTHVTTSFPTGHSSAKVMKVGWGFKTGQSNPWVRLNTFNPPQRPNPTMDGAQILRFDVNSTKALKVGVGMRETGTSAAYGANGGTTGTIDWAGVTNVVSGNPQASHQLTANTWTTLSLNIPFEPQAGFTGDGKVKEAKGVLEHLILGAVNAASGAYTVYLDNFAVVAQNTLTFSLDAGNPAGSAIDAKTGKFTWTPTTAGTYTLTVRVTDQLGAQDSETIKITVTGTGNNPPVLSAIGSKTVNELANLAFTATATDPDAGQTLTFSLDAGNPSGSTINGSTGAFSWTPTEAQGPGSYPITVRVTDNGSPQSNDFETITVTVREVNVAPVLSAIADQTVNEGSLLTLNCSASDADVPANTLTYSLDTGAPSGMAINSSSGVLTWTPTEAQGPDVYPVTVRVTDNGSPALYNTKSFNVTVNEVNVAPVLTLGTSMTTVTPIEDFESEDTEAANGSVMFRTASYSGTTSQFVDAGVGVYSDVYDSSQYPDVDVNTSLQVLHNQWNFKTGTTNPWVRLTTACTAGFTNTYATPNPTIDLTQHVKFKIWTDKSIKLGLGVRETGTGAPIGFDGGLTGTIEWLGVTNVVSGTPQPSRVISASNWTTVDFDLPHESIRAFTGNGVLDGTKGVLEHLAVIPNAGMGQYNVYLDDFQVVTVSTNLTIDTLATITVANSATDADLPANTLQFSLGTGAPTNAVIDPDTGVFTWTALPEQSPSTNNIQIIVTDDGVPPLSDSKTLVVKVNKVNTAPRIGGVPDQVIETSSGQAVTFTATAEDDDVPAQNLTFSLTGSVPPGATINSSTGDFSWTPPNGNSTNSFWVRVTDDGSPSLWAEEPVNIVVVPTNAPPVLTLGPAHWDEPFANFETFTNNTPNENVMFRKPSNSSTTSAYIDTTAANDTLVTTSFPTGHASAKVLKVDFTFKTSGTSQFWCRLDTTSPANLPNPTINFSQHLTFDIYTTKALLVGVGCRETATTNAIGADGGLTGAIEYVGCTNEISSTPFPSRLVPANTWTHLDLDLPHEPCQSLTGNGILAAGKGTLEHLILNGLPGGTGAYTVYLDNFTVVTTNTLPTDTVSMDTGNTLTFTASATDADSGSEGPLAYSLDADNSTNAVIDVATGVFSFTPQASDVGTNSITVDVQDDPTNGGIPKDVSSTFSVIVVTDPLGPK